jgi:hypothetical protein
LDPLAPPDPGEAAVHLQEHPLDDVLHVGRILYPPGHEGLETPAEREPQGFGPHRGPRGARRRGGRYLHPQPSACESPQQAVFAAGAQHEACLAGPQHAFGVVDAGKRPGSVCPDVFWPASCGRVVIGNLLHPGNAERSGALYPRRRRSFEKDAASRLVAACPICQS